MKTASEKEALGDWSNLKGTRFHLVYALWLLLRGEATEVLFFEGNDLLVRPARPRGNASADGPVVALRSVPSCGGTDVWVQLKATTEPWTPSALLEENLLFNFICNAAISEKQGRPWRVELVTEGDIRREEILGFTSRPEDFSRLNPKFKGIVESARQYLDSVSVVRSHGELSDLALRALRMVASKDRVALATLKAEVETAIMNAAPDWGAVRRIASTLIGAMLLDSAAGPGEGRTYTAEWVNEEAGTKLISDRPFDVNPIAACDLAVKDATRPEGLLPFDNARLVVRESLQAAVQQFLEASQPLFVLVGRSGMGKSWAIADLIRNTLRGQARVVGTGSEVGPSTTLAQMAHQALGRYSGRNEPPVGVFARLSAVSLKTGRGRVLFCIDDLRVQPAFAEETRRWLAALAKEAGDNGAKLLLSCQEETWDLLRLHDQLRASGIFNLRRGLDKGPVTHSYRLDVFSPAELESALLRRLPPERANRAFLHLRGSAFLYVRHPFILDRYLDLHGGNLGLSGTHPDPVAVDELLAGTIDNRLERVATALVADKESVQAAFQDVVDRLWQGRRFTVSSGDLVNVVAKHLPERGHDTVQELRAKGFLTSVGPPRWADGALGDYLYARRQVDRKSALSELEAELLPDQDGTVVEALVRMAENGPALAEHLLRRDPRWRSSVARGLSQRSPSESSTVALVASLTRPTDDSFVDSAGCEALGMLAARGRRGIAHRRAWRKAIEMYVSGNHDESLRGMHSLATVLEYEPELVSRLVERRVHSLARRPEDATRKDLGKKLDDALGALHNVTHRPAAEAVHRVLQAISPYESDTTMPKREKFLDTVDYLRGRIAPFLGSMHVDALIRELSSADRAVRLRAATAVRPAVYDAPERFRGEILRAIRVEEDPDVLLRILWAAPRLTQNAGDLLDAFAARKVPAWQHPVPCGPAFAILGEAADTEPERVSKMLPARLDYLPEGWTRACLSDVHALAWWRCAQGQTLLRSRLEELAEPHTAGVPRTFHAFLFRGTFVARLGLAMLERLPPARINVSMTSHRDGRMPYCYSLLEDFVAQHARAIAEMPEFASILDTLISCIAAGRAVRSEHQYRELVNMRFLCTSSSLDELCILANQVRDPLPILNRLPRDWEAIRAARLLLASSHTAEGLTNFAQSACDEHATSGTPQAWHERSLCLAHLAALRPDPVSEVFGPKEKFNPFAHSFGHDDNVDKMSLLIDQHPDQIVELLDRAIGIDEQIPMLCFWANKAREWKAQLLATVHRRMFDPRPISPVSAIRLVLDSLAALGSLPASAEREEFLAVFEGIHSWLMGSPVSVQVVGGDSPLRRSNRAAADILTSSVESFMPEQLLGRLMSPGLWWQSNSFRWADGSLQTGFGISYHALAVLPSIRLAAVAISMQRKPCDPVSNVMTERYRVVHELAEIDWRFTHPATTTPQRLEEWLDRVQRLPVVFSDERLMLRLGNLLVQLGRFEEAESQLRSAVSHPLCTKENLAAGQYDLACVAARTGRQEQCRVLLQEVLSLTPSYRSQIENDRDFESVRNLDWFSAIVMQPDPAIL